MKAPSDQPIAPVTGASIFANPAITNQMTALSPTPRKSERERKDVSYADLHTMGRHQNSDGDSVLGDGGYAGGNAGSNYQQKDKLKHKTNNGEDNHNKK